MRHFSVLFLALFLLLLLTSAAVRADEPSELPAEASDVLEAAASVTLYSLQPWGGPDLPDWDFYSHHILGKVDLHKDNAKKAIGAFKAAVAGGRKNSFSLCLISPRHALRVADGKHTYDLLLCYECGQLEVFRDSKEIAFLDVRDKPDVLNRLLKTAGIPLADTPEAWDKGYAQETKFAEERVKAGDADAQRVLGVMYLRGWGVKKNVDEGLRLLEKSVEKRSDDIKDELVFEVGDMFYNGYVLPKSYPDAVKWLSQSTGKNSAKSQSRIGDIYSHGGFGIDKNPTLAVKWHLLAAEQDDSGAQLMLGWAHFKGNGIKQDFVEAYKWFTLGNLVNDRLPKSITPEQMAEGKRLATEWKQSHLAKPAPLGHTPYVLP